jgi:hypothetical protein
VDWLDGGSWWQFTQSCREWLHRIEPSWVQDQPLFLRVLLYYLAALIALTVLVMLIWGTGYLVIAAVSRVLEAAATGLLFDAADIVAIPYVRVRTLGAGSLLSKPVRFKSRRSPPPGIEPLDLPDPLPLNGAVRVLRAFTMLAGFLSIALPTILFLTVRAMLRPRMVTFCALLLALWFADLLSPLLAAVGRVKIGDINLSVVVAAGTLLAILYAALNSDIRGRAELNKTASLACRTALHSSTNAMLDCADSLRAIREAAVRQLSRFPTNEELEQLTGRDDLHWGLLGPLPREAGGLNHQLRAMPFLQRPAVREFADEVLATSRTRAHEGRSLIMEGDVRDHVETLRDSSRRIAEKLDELHENGFTGKLDRVLGQGGTALLATAYWTAFGATIAQDVYTPDGEPGTAGILNDWQRREWAMLAGADPDDPRLRLACQYLHHQLRTVVRARHKALWRMAVIEYQLRHLVAKIDKTLSPRLIERVRQAFGK